MGKILLTSLCFFLVIAHNAAGESNIDSRLAYDDPAQWMALSYERITLSDGVSQDEARELSGSYFVAFISGCGGPFQITEEGPDWSISTLEGLGAQPGPTISINKMNGKIVSPGHPTVEALNSNGITKVRIHAAPKNN